MMRSPFRGSRATFVVGVAATLIMFPSLARAEAAQHANEFIDTVVNELPGEAARGDIVEPLPLAGFTIAVPKNGQLNRAVTANFTSCTLHGLFTATRRIGDASGPGIRSGEVTVGANLSLADVKILCDGTVRGDTFRGESHKIRTRTILGSKAYALAEFAAPPQTSGSRLVTLELGPLPMTTEVEQGKLDLNSSRLTSFVMQCNQNLSKQFADAARNKLGPVMNTVASRLNLPQS